MARQWKFLFWSPSSNRLSPAECARHKDSAVSASFCKMRSGAAAISFAKAIKARFSDA